MRNRKGEGHHEKRIWRRLKVGLDWKYGVGGSQKLPAYDNEFKSSLQTSWYNIYPVYYFYIKSVWPIFLKKIYLDRDLFTVKISITFFSNTHTRSNLDVWIAW